MQSGRSMRAQITTLRVAIEDFGLTTAGLVLSSYFAGFTLAALRCGRIIERIGHIRSYAAFAGLVAAATAAMALIAGPLAWLVLRAIVGFGCSGLFITTESWLNAKAPPAERGRIFSIYMVGTFLALAVGQLLIGRAKIETTGPFSAIVALFAVALVMVSTTRAEPPRATAAETLAYGQLARAAPVAVVGCVLSGLISGAFYALVPACAHDDRVVHARDRAWRPCLPDPGRLALGPFRPAPCAGGARPWLCRFSRDSGSPAALPAGGVTARGTARRLYVDALPGLCLPRA